MNSHVFIKILVDQYSTSPNQTNYFVFVYNKERGGEVFYEEAKEDDIYLKFGQKSGKPDLQTDRQTNIVVNREVKLSKMVSTC